jgi:hypothetical protein
MKLKINAAVLLFQGWHTRGLTVSFGGITPVFLLKYLKVKQGIGTKGV